MLARFLALSTLVATTGTLAAVPPPSGIAASLRAPADEDPAFVLRGEGWKGEEAGVHGIPPGEDACPRQTRRPAARFLP